MKTRKNFQFSNGLYHRYQKFVTQMPKKVPNIQNPGNKSGVQMILDFKWSYFRSPLYKINKQWFWYFKQNLLRKNLRTFLRYFCEQMLPGFSILPTSCCLSTGSWESSDFQCTSSAAPSALLVWNFFFFYIHLGYSFNSIFIYVCLRH